MDHSSVITRRRFLIRCTALGAGLSLAGLAGCSDGFEPKETWKLWVAKTLRGVVQSSEESLPLVDARVEFLAGLKLNEYALLGVTRTGIGGLYTMSAAENPSADAGFWRFIIDHSFFRTTSDDVPVYCKVVATYYGRQQELPFILPRKPQKSLPPESEAFYLTRNVRMF
jgi:hypothetical protein